MTANKRVLVIHQHALPRDHGGSTRHIDLFGRLKEWTPTIVATNFSHVARTRITTSDPRFRLVWGPEYFDNGLSRIAGWGIYDVEAFALGLTTKTDVVFGSSPQLLAPVAAWLLATLKRVPFVLEVRDLWPESIVAAGLMKEGSRVHRMLVGLERFLYRKAARIVVVTAGWEDHMRSLGIDPAKLVVIPNGTELSDFEVSTPREELRREFGINGYTAIFAGSHGMKDGIDLIVEAARVTPDVNFLLIGHGEMKEPMRARAAELGLTNIEFRDPIPKAELPRLLRACDVGLHVVRPLSVFNKGMSPNKLYDYFASGLPVVSNAKVPLRNVIVDDEVGAVVEPDGLHEGIVRVKNADQDTLDRWRERATALMRNLYSMEASSQRLAQVLDEAYASGRSRSR